MKLSYIATACSLCLLFALGLTGCSKNEGVVELTTVNLHIEGMHCTGCAAVLTKELGELEGIAAVEVSFEKQQAVITYDAARLSVPAIITAVSEVDTTYTASLPQPTAELPEETAEDNLNPEY